MTATEKTTPTSFTATIHLDALDVSDIPAFIGKGALNIKKNVKIPSWKMFSSWEKKHEKESTTNSLFVKIFDSEEKVMCEVKTSSEELLKFAVFNSKKAQKNFNTKVFNHTFYASMDNSLIPLFIGHKGRSVQTFLNRLSKDEDSPVQAGNPYKMENKGDIRLSIESHDYFSEDSDESLEDAVNKMIEVVDKSKFIDFIGWQPSSEEYEEYVKIKMSVYATMDDLTEIKLFMSDKINDYIQFIQHKHTRRSEQRETVEQDIDQALSSEY